MEPYTPRVYGYSPGSPIASSGSGGRSASVYNGLIGSPEMVENGASRSGVRPNVSRSQRSKSVRRGSVAIREVYGEALTPARESVYSVPNLLWRSDGAHWWQDRTGGD